MKKIINLVICGVVASLALIVNVSAATLTFDGDKTINSGQTGTVDIKLTASESEKIKQIEFSIFTTNSSDIAVGFADKANIYAGNLDVNKSTLTVGETGGSFANGATIATLRITNNNPSGNEISARIVIQNISFKLLDDSTISAPEHPRDVKLSAMTTTTQAKPKSNNSNLTSLTISAGTFSPAFKTDVYSYKIFGIKDTIQSVTVTPRCDNCTFTIKCESGCTNYNNQQKPTLEIGKNILKISTTSEDKANNSEYTLTIYRGETTDNSAFLESLEIANHKIIENFDKKVLDYTLIVPFESTDLEILAKPEDTNAKVEIKGAENLIVGENVITITVTSAETNEKKIYNVTVTRLEEKEEQIVTTPVVKQAEEPKSSKTVTIIVISAIAALLIGVSAYFIFRKKKGPKKPKNKKPEVITDEKLPKKEEIDSGISVQEDDLMNDLNMTDEKTKPSVEEALADLMTTKEIVLSEE